MQASGRKIDIEYETVMADPDQAISPEICALRHCSWKAKCCSKRKETRPAGGLDSSTHCHRPTGGSGHRDSDDDDDDDDASGFNSGPTDESLEDEGQGSGRRPSAQVQLPVQQQLAGCGTGGGDSNPHFDPDSLMYDSEAAACDDFDIAALEPSIDFSLNFGHDLSMAMLASDDSLEGGGNGLHGNRFGLAGSASAPAPRHRHCIENCWQQPVAAGGRKDSGSNATVRHSKWEPASRQKQEQQLYPHWVPTPPNANNLNANSAGGNLINGGLNNTLSSANKDNNNSHGSHGSLTPSAWTAGINQAPFNHGASQRAAIHSQQQQAQQQQQHLDQNGFQQQHLSLQQQLIDSGAPAPSDTPLHIIQHLLHHHQQHQPLHSLAGDSLNQVHQTAGNHLSGAMPVVQDSANYWASPQNGRSGWDLGFMPSAWSMPSPGQAQQQQVQMHQPMPQQRVHQQQQQQGQVQQMQILQGQGRASSLDNLAWNPLTQFSSTRPIRELPQNSSLFSNNSNSNCLKDPSAPSFSQQQHHQQHHQQQANDATNMCTRPRQSVGLVPDLSLPSSGSSDGGPGSLKRGHAEQPAGGTQHESPNKKRRTPAVAAAAAGGAGCRRRCASGQRPLPSGGA
ncbi:MAG: hypothetical protein WDW38_008606 [Sanguina aurantia]